MSIDSSAPNKQPEYSEVIACQFSSWYATFSNMKAVSAKSSRKSVTIKSVIIKDLCPDFIPYILSDGVILPPDATKVSSFLPQDRDDHEKWSSSSSSSSSSASHNEQDDDNSYGDNETDNLSCTSTTNTTFDLSTLTKQITNGIVFLGGSVFPKLNWSAPRDAAWMNNGSLRCETPGDVYLLIKSSDFCLHDILYVSSSESPNKSKTIDRNISHELVLRQWCNFWPSMEFRCFVTNYNIIAISQRNHLQCFGHLLSDKAKIRSLIIQFYEEFVRSHYSSKLIPDYVFDIYVDRNDVLWLIDFNVWGHWTDALLFTWDELFKMKDSLPCHAIHSSKIDDHNLYPEMRVVNSDTGIMGDSLSSYRAPIEAVDLAVNESTSFQEFMKLCKKPTQLEDDIK